MNIQTLKHQFRDFIIWALSFFGVAKLYSVYVCRKAPLVRVVVFHDVPDRSWFELMIKTLTESYAVISPQDFRDGVFDPRLPNVLVTFDDGYESWVTVAAPVLEQYGVKALFFVSSALLDGATDTTRTEAFMREQLHIKPRAALSWDGLRQLHVHGHTIGGHARTHANLPQLELETLVAEIEHDKHAIERALGVTISDFAYPFGTPNHVNESVIAVVKKVGYTRAYTATSGFVTHPHSYQIPRMCVENNTTPTQLRRWVGGAYDLFVKLKTWGGRGADSVMN